MNFIGKLLENLRDEKFIHGLETIWGVDSADMQSLSKYNKGIKCIYCVQLNFLVNTHGLFL